MLRIIMSLALAFSLWLPVGAQAQWFNGVASGLDLTGVDSFLAGLRPSCKIEYQQMSVSVNAPAIPDVVYSAPGGPTVTIPNVNHEVDLALKDANLWVGSLGVEAPFSQAWSLFGSVGTNFPRHIGAKSDQARLVGLYSASGSDPRQWDAANLRWILVDGGIRYRAFGGCSLLTGLQFRRLSFGLENPVGSQGDPFNYDGLPIGSQDISQRVLGDAQIKSWLPYIGIMNEGDSYRFSLIFSPWASTTLKLPFSAHQQSQVVFLPISGEDEFSWRFRALQPSVFLEGSFEYELMAWSPFTLAINATGSWLRMNGPIDFLLHHFSQGSFFGIPYTSTADGSDDPEGSFTQCVVSIGFAVEFESGLVL